jgi:serine/threonine protein kinase
MAAKLIGETLLGQFRVDEFIASGGMGAVYRVWDIKRNAPLAMKVLHADLADDPIIARRFQREANSLKELAHPNILPFYGLFEVDRLAFLLVAYVDGPTLKDLIDQRLGRSFSPLECLTLLKALSAALGYAHVNGVIHCDVKPGNVMIDMGGNIYLTDFGIARNLVSTTTTLGIAGTPTYMAPEQIRGEQLSPATDIYALGVMLFELLTGERPFRGIEAGTESAGATTNERICFAHLHLPPPDPGAKNPALPAALSQVVLKSLEKDPRKRYADTLSLYTACLASLGVDPASIPDRWSQQKSRAESSEATLRAFSGTMQDGKTIAPPPPIQPSPFPGETSPTRGFPPQAPATGEAKKPRLSGLIAAGGIIAILALIAFGWGFWNFGGKLFPSSTTTSIPQFVQVTSTATHLDRTMTPIIQTEAFLPTNPTSTRRPTNAPSPTPSTDPRRLPAVYSPLPKCAKSRLKTDDWVFISFGGGHNDIRSTADTHSSTNTIGEAQEGELLLVTGGPECNYGWILWEVQTSSGLSGWTPESDGKDFWLNPFPSWEACPDSLPSYLVKGVTAMIAPFPQVANKIREGPGTDYSETGSLNPGEMVMVLDGPHCASHYVWWRVRSMSSGMEGWTADGNSQSHYLIPLVER